MAKRIIDADKMWTSTKLARCRPESIPEYPWIYGVADSNGNFEYDPRGIYGKAYFNIRPTFTFERFLAVLEDFRNNGLLFTWEENGKLYGHWTGSELPGRLPEQKKRYRYEQIRVKRMFEIGDPEVAAYIETCLAKPTPQAEMFPAKELPSKTIIHRQAATIVDDSLERALNSDQRMAHWKEFWLLYPENRRGSEKDTRQIFMHVNKHWVAAKGCTERLKQWLFSEEWRNGHIPMSEKFFDKEKYKSAPPEPKEKPNGFGLTAREKLERTRRLLQ